MDASLSLRLPVSAAMWFMICGMLIVSTLTAIWCQVHTNPMGMITTISLGIFAILAFIVGSYACPDENSFYTPPGEDIKNHIGQVALKTASWFILCGIFVSAAGAAAMFQGHVSLNLVPVEIVCAIAAVIAGLCGYTVWETGLSDEQLIAICLQNYAPGSTIWDSSARLPQVTGEYQIPVRKPFGKQE